MRTRLDRWLTTALLVAGALMLTASSAAADDAKRARTLYEQGIEATQAERHLEAGAAFLEAYALDPNGSLLWNAARSYDAGGEHERARALYTRYVGITDAVPEKVDRARSWLETHPDAEESTAEPAERVRVLTDRMESAGSPVTGWTLTGLGVAAVVGASVTLVFAAQSRDTSYGLVWGQNYEETLRTHRRLTEETETLELAGWLTLGVAAGLIGSGLTFLFAGGTEDVGDGRAETPTLTLSPVDGGVCAGASWRF